MSDSTVLENSLKLQLHKAPNHSGLSQRWLSYMTPDIQELEQIKDHFMYLGKSWVLGYRSCVKAGDPALSILKIKVDVCSLSKFEIHTEINRRALETG